MKVLISQTHQDWDCSLNDCKMKQNKKSKQTKSLTVWYVKHIIFVLIYILGLKNMSKDLNSQDKLIVFSKL